MLKLLLGKSESRKPVPADPLDKMRYTRFEHRKATMTQPTASPEARAARQQDCAMHADVQSAPRPTIPKAPVAAARPRRVQKVADINLSEHLYSEAAISVALLRRSLPMRFRDVDARKQKALASFENRLQYAIG